MSAVPPFSSLATRPAFPAAVALIAGIAAHRLLPANPPLWLSLAALLAVAAGCLLRKPKSAATCLLFGLGFCGVASAQLVIFYFPPDHIGLFAADEPHLASVQVQVESPVHLITSESGKHIPPRIEFTAAVRRIRTWTGWETASGSLMVSVGQDLPAVSEGQTLELAGMLQRPLPADNPGQFDWARYDRSQRLLAELHVSHASGIRIITPGTEPVVARARQDARAALESGFSPSNLVEQNLLIALVFGDRAAPLRDVDDAFRRTGNAHLLASNGLRIVVLAAGIYLLCVLLRLSPRRSVWIATIAVVIFGLLTSDSPQALRPVLLCAALGIVITLRRRIDSVQLLSLAALAILVVEPMDLYAAGFQLGFVTVLGMMLFTGTVSNWIGEWEDPHRRAARSLIDNSSFQHFRFTSWDHFRRDLATGLVAWVVATPLVIFHFEQFNLWTIPIAVILSPLVFICMVAGFLKIVLTLAIPHLAPQWAAVALFPAALLDHTVFAMSKIPADDLPVTSPSVALIMLSYLLICLPAVARLRLFDWIRRPWMNAAFWRWTGRCAPACFAMTLLIVPSRHSARAPPGDLQVTLLSVGAGQTAVVELPDGRAMLFDCGSTTLSDDMRQCLAPFLRHEGRSHLDAIYLSHGDYDHISAAAAAVNEYGVREVLVGPNFRLHAHESATAEALLETLDQQKIIPQIIFNGRQIDLGDGATLSVLWPPPLDTSLNSNNSGVVMKLTYAGRSILFPADIQVPPEHALLAHPAMLASDVLVAPHHGSAEPSTSDFVAAVHPHIIVSSNASRLTQKQRAFDRLADARPLYRTSQCGALTIIIDQNGKMTLHGFLRLREEHEPPGQPDGHSLQIAN